MKVGGSVWLKKKKLSQNENPGAFTDVIGHLTRRDQIPMPRSDDENHANSRVVPPWCRKPTRRFGGILNRGLHLRWCLSPQKLPVKETEGGRDQQGRSAPPDPIPA
jgi:hypothetical protein